jgi:hypothetical protein
LVQGPSLPFGAEWELRWWPGGERARALPAGSLNFKDRDPKRNPAARGGVLDRRRRLRSVQRFLGNNSVSKFLFTESATGRNSVPKGGNIVPNRHSSKLERVVSTVDEECIGYARECVRLAGLTQDQQLREQLLNMAREWMATAMHERRRQGPKSFGERPKQEKPRLRGVSDPRRGSFGSDAEGKLPPSLHAAVR